MAGYRLVRADAVVAPRSMAHALGAVAARGHTLSTIVDIGASDGSWTREALRHFPSARYLLVEAQSVHEPELIRFASTHPNVAYVLAAAGAERGSLFFDASTPLGGQASAVATAQASVRVPVTTIDAEVAERGLTGPFLLKFDTHGFEMPILRGAQETLARTDVIVMECYNFDLGPDCLRFPAMCAQLEAIGFRCVDFVDTLYRPTDGAFWQADLVFIRADRPEFASNEYD